MAKIIKFKELSKDDIMQLKILIDTLTALNYKTFLWERPNTYEIFIQEESA